MQQERIFDVRYEWSLNTSFERQNQTKRSSPAGASTVTTRRCCLMCMSILVTCLKTCQNLDRTAKKGE